MIRWKSLANRPKPWKFWLPPQPNETGDLLEEATSDDVTPPRRKEDELVCGKKSRLELERMLKNLYRRSTADYQERGVRILYVAFGLLRWNLQRRRARCA